MNNSQTINILLKTRTRIKKEIMASIVLLYIATTTKHNILNEVKVKRIFNQ